MHTNGSDCHRLVAASVDDNNNVIVIATSATLNGVDPKTLTPCKVNASLILLNATSIFLVLPLHNAGRSSVRSNSSQSSVVDETLCPERALSMPLPPKATMCGGEEDEDEVVALP